MYHVEVNDDVADQIAALPAEALHSFASVLDLLALHPWSGDSYNRRNPDAEMRVHTLGEKHEGLIVYLILERQQRVAVLRVLWSS